ncbi:MAG TPA: malectin domain-containing carbohydrate-binding protein [bacterium]|nr:malectin domain-containing carbohydrate-binding protein [bacterium]
MKTTALLGGLGLAALSALPVGLWATPIPTLTHYATLTDIAAATQTQAATLTDIVAATQTQAATLTDIVAATQTQAATLTDIVAATQTVVASKTAGIETETEAPTMTHFATQTDVAAATQTQAATLTDIVAATQTQAATETDVAAATKTQAATQTDVAAATQTIAATWTQGIETETAVPTQTAAASKTQGAETATEAPTQTAAQSQTQGIETETAVPTQTAAASKTQGVETETAVPTQTAAASMTQGIQTLTAAPTLTAAASKTQAVETETEAPTQTQAATQTDVAAATQTQAATQTDIVAATMTETFLKPSQTQAATQTMVAAATLTEAYLAPSQTEAVTQTDVVAATETEVKVAPTQTAGAIQTMVAGQTLTQAQTETEIVESYTPTPTLTPIVGCGNITVVRVACGNSTYTDSGGNVWSADYGSSGGNTTSSGDSISGTKDASLFDHNRWGNPVTYTFAVQNGTYMVVLYNAETYWGVVADVGGGAGDRVFNIAINGTTVKTGYDIFAAAGGANIATSLTFTTTVTNNVLTITGSPTKDNAQFCAIQVIYESGTPCPTNTPTPPCGYSVPVERVACGESSNYTDSSGNIWLADISSTASNSTASTGNSISGTSDQKLFQYNRWGNPCTYSFSVANGTYEVLLDEAEVYWGAAGDRIFDIWINGVDVKKNYDIYASAGGADIAQTLTFTTTVTTGAIVISGVASRDNAQFCAIELILQGPACTPTDTPTAPPGGYPTPTPSCTFTPTTTEVWSGLPTNMRPYGLEYVPFPVVNTGTNAFYPLYMTFSAQSPNGVLGGGTTNLLSNNTWGAPVNTARWRIVFQNLSATVGAGYAFAAQNLTVGVETRIGANGIGCNTGVYDPDYLYNATSLSLPTHPQNYSGSYFWMGVSSTVVPYTERFDAVGDPRFVPYADELDYSGNLNDGLQGGYNWFWRNFTDGNSLYPDNSYYQPFLPSANFDLYNTQQNIDIPKLFQLIRQGVMISNGVYTAMTGWDSYYAGQGGEIGGDNSNDFQAGVPCYGGPWGSTSNSWTVDEIIGGANTSGATYVVQGNGTTTPTWQSLPFLGELWPDSLYQSNWESPLWSGSAGTSSTWGNLNNLEQGGSCYREPMGNLQASTGSNFNQAYHRNYGNGCATLENGTNDGNTPFDHDTNQFNATEINDGIQLGSDYNFALPSSFNVTRPWGLTEGGNQPQEWNMTSGDSLYDYPNLRTHLDVYSAVTYVASTSWGFYADDADGFSSSSFKSAAAIRTVDMNKALTTASGNPAGGWIIVNGLAPSTASGINFVAQFAILTCLRTFADAGVPTQGACTIDPGFVNANNTYSLTGAASGSTYRIPPVPLVSILHPTTSDLYLGMTTIPVQWDERYARWDGQPYDENYPCVDANTTIGPCASADVLANPALEWHDVQPIAFNIIYNIPSQSSLWYSAITNNIVTAGPGNSYVTGAAGNYMNGADAVLPGSSYQTSPHNYSYAWTNIQQVYYNLEVECFRLSPQGVAYPHYGYHKIQINLTNTLQP